MTKIKAIGFDFGGVVGGDPSLGHRFTEASADLLGFTVEAWREKYFSMNDLLNSGKVSSKSEFWLKFLTSFDQQSKLQAQLALDNSLSDQYMVINTQIIELIDILRRSGYKVGLLSNASSQVKSKILNLNISSHFDLLLFSADLKLQKPDPRAFQALAEALNVDMAELVFIDDAEKSLSTAQQTGFTPILYSSFDQLVKDLLSLDISY